MLVLLSAFALRVKEPSEIPYIYVCVCVCILGNSGNKERKRNWGFEEKQMSQSRVFVSVSLG